MANWYEMLKEIMNEDGEDFDKRQCTLSDEKMRREFKDCQNELQGSNFTAWGKNWVYFPICYDGSEWIGHAPRNPCNISMEHQGGG